MTGFRTEWRGDAVAAMGANEQAITDEMITVAVAALLAPLVEESGV